MTCIRPVMSALASVLDSRSHASVCACLLHLHVAGLVSAFRSNAMARALLALHLAVVTQVYALT
jgi:hypothetical protein